MLRNEILRSQKWRLGIIRHTKEATHNIDKTCQYFGISRTAFYRWYERYRKYGEEGLNRQFSVLLRIQFETSGPMT